MKRLSVAILLLVASAAAAGLVSAQAGSPRQRRAPAREAPAPPPEEEPAEEPAESEPTEEDEEVAEEGDEDVAGEPYEPRTEPPTSMVPRTLCQGRTIRRIRVTGAKRVDDDDILATLGLRPGEVCTDPEVAQAARNLWDMGFFEDVVLEGQSAPGEKIDLLVRVEERPAIGRIVYEGADALSTDDISEKVSLREGEILSVPEVQRQITNIRDLYAEKGYFLARVRYDLTKMPDRPGEVEVRFLIDEGEEVAVRRIRFVGNEQIKSSELRGVMQTSQTSFFSFISSSNRFQSDAFEEDLVRLQAYYYDLGYLEMNAGSPQIELTPDRQHVDITIPLEEGPRYRISEMRVAELGDDGEEVESLAPPEFLRGSIDAKVGDYFSRSQIAEGLQEITRYYRDRGYAKVQVTPETELHADARTVDVRIAIRRGPLVRIERIHIRGNTKTRDRVIRREIRVLESELYNQSKVEFSKERIQALGYFERVDVAEEEGSSPDQIVLNFQVAERPTGTFQVGAGFSSIESFILTAQIQQQNLFGNGQALSLQLQLSGIRQLAQVRFVEPYLFDSKWSASVDLFKVLRQFPNFVRDSTGGSISFGHPIFDDRLRLFLQYRADMVKIDARTGGLFGRSPVGAGFRLPEPPIYNLYVGGLTSSLQLSLSWDSRDNRLFPTKGVFATVATEVADPVLGSDNVFVRNTAFLRYYRPLFGPFVLKTNLELGLVTSRDPQGVRIFERFFLGGIFNVRGFRWNELGPRAGLGSIDPNARPSDRGIVVGGNVQAFYNIEIEFPIVQAVGIRGVIFTDGGNTWNLENQLCQVPATGYADAASNPCSFKPWQIRTSYGFGFRWFSPLGPLRFEWGLPFRPRPWEDPILFEFTIGNFF